MTDIDADTLPPPPPPGRGSSAARPAGSSAGGAAFGPARLVAFLAGVVLLGALYPWVLIVIVAIVTMVFLHELGHYITAKRAGMKVTEFFIGFGPKLWSFQRGETEYGVKLIPAGAYVKIIGMHNLEEVAPEDEGRTYRQKSFGRRLSVAVAGSTMHFLLAFVLIFLALVAVGQPGGTLNPKGQETKWAVGSVVKSSGAADAGLHKGDKVLAVAGRSISRFTDLKAVVQKHKGEVVPVVVVRNGERLSLDAKLRSFNAGDGTTGCCLGIGPTYPVQRLSPVEGLVKTPREFVQVTTMSVGALGRFFTPSGISDYAGQVTHANDRTQGSTQPAKTTSSGSGSDDSGSGNRLLSIYGLVRIGAHAGAVDAGSLIGLFALINIFIGVFNLVPLLPFDGGHVAIAIYEKIQERRLRRKRYFTDVAKLLPLTYVVVLLLGMIFVSSLYLDIANPIGVK
jgi:membrane-associated protease RseP (regulator of RpoE activity)